MKIKNLNKNVKIELTDSTMKLARRFSAENMVSPKLLISLALIAYTSNEAKMREDIRDFKVSAFDYTK